VLRHIRLLVFDLDYLIFDCSLLKVRALRQTLISFADAIPQSIRLPDVVDVEEGFRANGFRWIQFLEIGLDEEQLEELRHAYGIHEDRLIQAGVGRLYPGVADFFARCKREGTALALGADASRDYLMAVSDRHHLEDLFEISLCTEEFGVGSADEMLEEIMHHAEVNPSETLVFGTRSLFFQAAHNLDILTIGCGWGIRQHDELQAADLQALTLTQLYPAIQKADELAAQFL
jgi:phosphoglycolate phosphatase-like HAD superfamily hydrolase